MTVELVQGTPEWHAARCGSVGASEVADATRKLAKGEPAATRAALMARKVVERLTGRPVPTYVSRAMLDGSAREEDGRASYEAYYEPVELIGLVRHPFVPWAHASPDGLVGADGLIEIKCPEHAQHLTTLLGEPVKLDYRKQMQWQMACTGRAWCDFVSYHPDFPEALQLWKTRFERDQTMINELVAEVGLFNEEVQEKVAVLASRYGLLEAA